MEEFSEPEVKRRKLSENSQENIYIEPEEDFTQDTEIPDDQFLEEKCSNFVSQEELERLKEFKVLDEVKSNDGDSHDGGSDSSDDKSEGVPEEEIEKMLDEDLPEELKAAPKPKEKPYVTRTKVVLEEKGVNHFEVLPLDWMMVRHYSGMPVYMHRTTRVCTLSKPYFLGKGNTRRHDIPISAIPCLAYRKALEEEEKQKEIDKQIEEQIRNGTWKQQDKTQNKPTDVTKKTDQSSENVKKCPYKHDDSKEEIVSDVFSEESSRKCHFKPESSDNNSDDSRNSPKCPFKGELSDEKLSDDSFIIKCNDVSESLNIREYNQINNLDKSETKLEKADIDSLIKNHLISDESNNDLSGANKKEVKLTDDQNQKLVYGESKENEENLEVVREKIEIENSEENSTEFIKNDDIVNKSAENIENGEETSTEPNQNVEIVNGEEKENEEGIVSEQNQDDNSDKTEELPLNRQPVVLPGGIVMPPPRVETVSTSWKTQHLTHEQVNDYCKKLFQFKTVNIMHFKRWADRRKYTKARKTLQYPTLPEGTKLITIPAQPAGQENGGAGGKATKRDWVMNMNGRSYLSVFHEYVRRALQKQPVYEFKQLENAATPYQATVYIGGMQYGVGHGSSKRAAKSAAARASIHVLIPEMRQELEGGKNGDNSNEPDFSFFDYVGIEDPRVTEFCAAACEPSPHAILRTCLLRNFGATDTHIQTETKKLEYQKIELTMKVGKHSASVVCKNKKTAKQRASQAILQALHPHVRSWGSLLRLYGSRSVKSCAEKKLEEQQITLLQDAARRNEPNYAVLEKLKHDMRKLAERDAAVVPIGTLLLDDDLPQHSGSNLTNVDF